MSSVVCPDASLSLKLVLSEPDSDLARTLWATWLEQQAVLIVPMLWGYEVTSVLRNHVYRNLLSSELANDAFAQIHQLTVQMVDPIGLHQRAWELARHFNRPAAYDAHYLALAEMAGCPFWTADERLFNAVRTELEWVHWLGNYSPATS